MTAERIYPYSRKVYYYNYNDGNTHISFRLFGEGCSPALQFIFFDSPDEAKQYFERELL